MTNNSSGNNLLCSHINDLHCIFKLLGFKCAKKSEPFSDGNRLIKRLPQIILL